MGLENAYPKDTEKRGFPGKGASEIVSESRGEDPSWMARQYLAGSDFASLRRETPKGEG